MSLPDPITRKEMYLNKAATGSGSVPPEPVTREEMYLAEIAKGGGSGYTVDETRTVIITEQTVTTKTGEDFPQVNGYFANVTNSAILPETFPDTILLTADGVEYQLPKLEFSEGAVVAYGEIVDMSTIDWSNYPVQVMCIDLFGSGQFTVFVVTETAGTYTVKAESVTKSMTVSPEFQEARGYTSEERVTLVTEATYTFVADGSGWAGVCNVVSEEIPEIDPLSPPAYVTITVDGVAYEKEYNESESDSHVAVYGNYYDTATVDCALLLDLDKVMAENPADLADPVVQFAPETEQEQHTVSAYFTKKPVTTTPDFDAAVAKATEPLVVPMTFTNPSNPLAGGTYDSAYYDKMFDAFTEGRKIMLEVPAMGLLQIINTGSTGAGEGSSAVFNCMTMAYLANTYLLIVLNLDKDGNVNVLPFTLTQFP